MVLMAVNDYALPTEDEADKAWDAGHRDGLEGDPRDDQLSSLSAARSLRARALARLYLRAYNQGRQERLQRLYGAPPA